MCLGFAKSKGVKQDEPTAEDFDAHHEAVEFFRARGQA